MSSRNTVPVMGILNIRVREDETSIIAEGKCILLDLYRRERIDTDKLRVGVACRKDYGSLRFESRWGRALPMKASLHKYVLRFDKSEMKNLDIQNKVVLTYKEKYEGRVLYDIGDWKQGHSKNSNVFIHDDTSIYFRQNRYNSLTLTIRDTNRYDYPEEQARIEKAYRKARKNKDNNLVLMFEKNCSRYEESASVLYEKLIDEGYDNVYYIVNEDNPRIQNLDEKYRRNMIAKDSDKHLEYFFACNKFIATETMEHAFQLRVANRHAMEKTRSKDLEYVFLQHGPTYMVALTSDLRTGFRKGQYKVHKTVVSSRLEADHFIEAAGMTDEDLYITGMAKFDRCTRKPDADKIIIMMTWRRWEMNQASENIEETKYYKMTERLYNAVPEELKDKVIILPHPLMADKFKGAKGMGEHIQIVDSYDDILKECNLLITDYSSIAYDAFYRGTNVCFCWEEKEECMQHYGENAYLLLNEENAYGDVCMNSEQLTAAVRKNYMKPQSEENIAKYRKIIAFHDGRNSERIVEHLKADGII